MYWKYGNEWQDTEKDFYGGKKVSSQWRRKTNCLENIK
jgi:hypothetical protein